MFKNPVVMKMFSILVILLVVLGIFAAVSAYVQSTISKDFQMSNVPLRFAFVALGLVIAFLIYVFTSQNKMWEVGTRQVVFMAIGAALYTVFSYLFNGSVFVVPSVSQVALRPAIAFPIFFGYVFGPVVGFFTGAVGNMFGDALTGFGLSPQWSIGNGLIGMIAGMVFLFKDKKKSLDTVLIISAVLAVIVTVLYAFNSTLQNKVFFNTGANIFGDQPLTIFAGLSIVIGFALILIIRFAFYKNIDLATAVTWGMLGIFLGLGFAAISDIWINGYSPTVAVVGEFLPSAGPDLIFAAILVPILLLAYYAVQRQSGR
jgi:uncharacterized membrane protein